MATVTHSGLGDQFSDQDQYRPLSTAAVASLVAGGLSLGSFLSSLFWVIPILGVLLGLVSLHRINTYPDEVTGRKLALAGIVLSALFGGLGAAWQTYNYLAEVPDGYQRISYAQLQPADGAAATPTAIPATARLLDGKRIFVKGFMYPGSQNHGIKEFVLCRDKGTCCFGGPTPKLTDMIQVRLTPPLTTDFYPGVRAIAGVFRVESAKASDNLGGVLYQLDADYVR